MTVTIGCYDFLQGQGTSAQIDAAEAAGADALEITNPSFFHNADVLLLDIQPGVSSAVATAASAVANASAFAGEVVVMNDDIGAFVPLVSPGGAGAEQVNFVNDSGLLAAGPGGTLTDASLDNHGVSNAGAFPPFLEDAEIAYLATRDDPNRPVVVALSENSGWFIYSAVTASAGLESGDPGMTAFVTNELAYAAHLAAQAETALGQGSDKAVGSVGDDEIFGLGGDDRIAALDGDDIIHAGDGDDCVKGGRGGDIAWGDTGSDQLKGLQDSDQLWGGAGDDVILGNAGDDFLQGGSGDDRLNGDAGSDALAGGTGQDHLRGSDGDDLITGGQGDDVMSGGDGADRFFFAQTDSTGPGDVITDFVSGQDTIDLTEFAHAFTFSPDGAFSHTAYEIAFLQGAGVTVVGIDIDGDGSADETFAVHTGSGPVLTQTDFVF